MVVGDSCLLLREMIAIKIDILKKSLRVNIRINSIENILSGIKVSSIFPLKYTFRI